MAEFPLYQTLSQNARSKDISIDEKGAIMSTISSLTEEEKEALFLLIYEHYRVSKKITNSVDLQNLDLPYGMKKSLNGSINFSLSKLPTKLRQIILKFVQIVVSNRESDKK